MWEKKNVISLLVEEYKSRISPLRKQLFQTATFIMSGINSRDAEVAVFCHQFILYSCHYKHKESMSEKRSHSRDGSVLRFRKK